MLRFRDEEVAPPHSQAPIVKYMLLARVVATNYHFKVRSSSSQAVKNVYALCKTETVNTKTLLLIALNDRLVRYEHDPNQGRLPPHNYFTLRHHMSPWQAWLP
jgi:hypothetical protein